MTKFKLFNNENYKLLNKNDMTNTSENVNKKKQAMKKKAMKKQHMKKQHMKKQHMKKQHKKKQHKKKQPNSTLLNNQFDTLMFGDNTIPSSYNSGNSFNLTRDLDFKNNYSRFAMKNMHYGIVKKEDFTHDNMVPYTAKRDFQVTKKIYQNRKLQIHSGIDDHFKPKKEIESIFKPIKDITYVRGAPVFTNQLEKRYIVNKKKHFNDLPFENNIKIKPGIDGKNQASKDTVYRILPKRSDDLKSKNNKQISYISRKIHAIKKGGIRGINPNITKYKLPDHREQKASDLIPSKSMVNKQKVIGSVKKPTSNRSSVNNYIGPGKNTNKGDAPSKNKSKWNKSSKVTFHNDNQRNISNSNNKKQTQNKKSYTAYNTQRVTTNYEEKGNIHNNNMGNYAYDPTDIPLTTMKEMLIHNNNILGAHQSNGNKEYVFSKDRIIPTNSRESYSTYSHPKGANSNVNANYSKNPNHIARKTIRQTTQKNTNEGNVHNNVNANYSKNPNHIARKTIRQTTQKNTNEGNVHNNINANYSKNPNDITRKTIKQTTLHSTPHMNINNQNDGTYKRNKGDTTKTTIKQTTLHSTPHMNINNRNDGTYKRNKGEIAKATIKQTTLHSTPHMNINNRNDGTYKRNKGEIAKNTIKQTTLHSTPHMNINNRNDGTYKRNKGETAKATIKQTTLHSTPHMNINNPNDGTYKRNKGETAKATIKQTTLHSTPHMNINNPNDGTYKRNKGETARPTIKQTTLLQNYTGGLTAEIEKYRDRTDINNMEIDPRREILTYNRTPGGKYDGPHIIDKQSYQLKETVNVERDYLNKHNPIDRNIIDSELDAMYSRNKDKVNQIEGEYRINYNFTSELVNNPYVNNTILQKNTIN